MTSEGAVDSGCKAGWTDKKNGDNMCQQPQCFGNDGDNGCDNDGECIAPNYCICGRSGAQVVGVQGEYEVNGKMVDGTQCISLRKSGIKGAFIALAVMCVSITFCGCIELQRSKSKKIE